MGDEGQRRRDSEDLAGRWTTQDLESTPESRLIVELLPDGRMRAPNAQTRELLRDRLRHAEVLPTAPGWAVLRCIGESKVGPAGRREVVAAGTLGEAGIYLMDFIGFLATGYQTGVLTVATNSVELSLALVRGDVVAAGSTAPEDRLLEWLVAHGHLGRDQAQQLLRQHGEAHAVAAAAQRGWLSASIIEAAERELQEALFLRLLELQEGTWYLARYAPDAEPEALRPMPTQALLVESLRKLDELQVYRQRIRSVDIVVEPVRAKPTPTELSRLDDAVRAEALPLLALITGPTTLRDLLRTSHKVEFEVTRLVYHLLRANLLELSQGPKTEAPMRPAASRAEVRELVAVHTLAIREMFEEVQRIGRARDLLAAVHGFLADEASPGVAGILRHARVAADGTLSEATLVAGVETLRPSSQELGDALSELLFFVLFQATEILGRRRGDDLARRVKMILGMAQGRVLGP